MNKNIVKALESIKAQVTELELGDKKELRSALRGVIDSLQIPGGSGPGSGDPKLFGNSKVRVLKALGDAGFTTKEARAVFENLGIELGTGWPAYLSRGKAAELSPEQLSEFRKLAGMAQPGGKPALGKKAAAKPVKSAPKKSSKSESKKLSKLEQHRLKREQAAAKKAKKQEAA